MFTALDVSALLSNLAPAEDQHQAANQHRRKRRRGEVANPSNTLDALVARKADDEQPFEKRYLSEHEAIEGPDDEVEMRRMETDPDVSTRTCSTCGYQGKWVSEMIRHKRVHTSERPFKCRYCSRTSKWKADLIRHVAKTHGIRVVSKYSRSKVFDANTTTNTADVVVVEKRSMLYRCQVCSFEDERVSVLNSHVALAHGTAPCVCRCGARFDEVHAAVAHTAGPCTHAEMVFNVQPTYEKTSPLSSPCQSETSSDSGIQTDPEEETTVVAPVQPLLLPDIQSLLTFQSTPLMSLYLASLLQSLSPTTPLAPPPQLAPLAPLIVDDMEEVVDVEM